MRLPIPRKFARKAAALLPAALLLLTLAACGSAAPAEPEPEAR